MIVCNFSWSSPLGFFILWYDKSYKYVLLIFRPISMAYEPTFHDVLIIPYFIWNHLRIFLNSSNSEKKKVYVLFSFFSSSFVSQINWHLLHRLKKKTKRRNEKQTGVCNYIYKKPKWSYEIFKYLQNISGISKSFYSILESD